jgi:HEAT repeat protein
MTGLELLIMGKLGGLATVAGLLTSARRAGERRARALLLQARHEALRAAGAGEVEASSTWVPQLSAEVGVLRLHLEELGQAHVRPSDPWPLTLERETTGDALAKAVLGARELVTGDPAFDDAFHVTGPRLEARAALDAPTRAALLVLSCEALLTLDPRGIVTIVHAPSPARADHRARAAFVERLTAVIQHSLTVARRLCAEEEPAQRLAEIVRTDPLATVRRACLGVLLRAFEDHEITREILPQACDDADPEVRLRAAIARGERGVPTLAALADDEDAPDVAVAAAVTALGSRSSLAQTCARLERARAAGREETARACVARLVSSGDPAVIAPLVALLRASPGSVSAAACEALVTLRATQAEGALREVLDHDDEGAVSAAARALGQLGSIASVPALRAAEERAREHGTRLAAREAVAAIQARASGATPGQLSLATGDAGRIALTDDPTGRVALAEDDAP